VKKGWLRRKQNKISLVAFSVHRLCSRFGYLSDNAGLTAYDNKTEPLAMNESQEAYDRILRPIEDRMIQSIWRIVRDSQDAEDALQNALVTVWKRWDRVIQHPCPEALVLKICADAAYDLTRRRVRERKTSESGRGAADELSDMSTSPSEVASSHELHREIIAAIHRLPRQQALAILMRVIQGQSYRDVTAALECNEATARNHVARGRTRLQTLISHLDPTNAVRS